MALLAWCNEPGLDRITDFPHFLLLNDACWGWPGRRRKMSGCINGCRLTYRRQFPTFVCLQQPTQVIYWSFCVVSIPAKGIGIDA